LASSPPCTSCGRRAPRYRKRTDDCVCRRCAAILPAVEVRLEQLPLPQLRRRVRRRRAPSRSDLAWAKELDRAVAEVEVACGQFDEAVARICKQHRPLGCLPPVLAFVTGAIVGGVTARSIRWYWAALLALAGTIATWFSLSLFRLVSWSRNHPLLARMEHPQAKEVLQARRQGRRHRRLDVRQLRGDRVAHRAFAGPVTTRCTRRPPSRCVSPTRSRDVRTGTGMKSTA
jgi:hypothetical protein